MINKGDSFKNWRVDEGGDSYCVTHLIIADLLTCLDDMKQQLGLQSFSLLHEYLVVLTHRPRERMCICVYVQLCYKEAQLLQFI